MFEVRPKPLALDNGRFAHNAPWPASFTGVALGVLDGWRGLLVASMAAYTDWIKYWRLLRQESK